MKTCALCGAEKDVGRIPTGWKLIGDVLHCEKCKLAKYALRAVTIPIVSPVGIGWPDLRKLLRESFSATTEAANFVVREMAKVDDGLVAAANGKRKLGKLPKCYFYPEIRKRWPALATCSVNSLEQAVQAKYRAARLDMVLGKKSLPSFRYPHPIPVHNATWSVKEGDDGGLELSFLLSGERVTVRLKGGVNYRRQLVDVRRLISGEARQGQLDIMEHGTKVLCKMVGWFPRTEKRDGWAASLVSGGDAFLTLYNDDRRTIYRWNADHVRRRIAAQDEQMQRLREDLKAEKRLGRERDGILARMDLLRQRHHDYMHSFCHDVSRQVIGHLSRRRCALVMVSMDDKSYMPHFPWHKLGTMLADKANRAGIEIASGDGASESPVPLEGVAQ